MQIEAGVPKIGKMYGATVNFSKVTNMMVTTLASLHSQASPKGLCMQTEVLFSIPHDRAGSEAGTTNSPRVPARAKLGRLRPVVTAEAPGEDVDHNTR